MTRAKFLHGAKNCAWLKWLGELTSVQFLKVKIQISRWQQRAAMLGTLRSQGKEKTTFSSWYWSVFVVCPVCFVTLVFLLSFEGWFLPKNISIVLYKCCSLYFENGCWKPHQFTSDKDVCKVMSAAESFDLWRRSFWLFDFISTVCFFVR